jgi:hypothetical protein
VIDVGSSPCTPRGSLRPIWAVRDKFTLQSLARSRGKRQRRPGKHSLPRGENPIRNNGADVAELVDARDLKFVALVVSARFFCITRPQLTVEADGTKRDLDNGFRAGFQ